MLINCNGGLTAQHQGAPTCSQAIEALDRRWAAPMDTDGAFTLSTGNSQVSFG
jgi:hypothetical protein